MATSLNTLCNRIICIYAIACALLTSEVIGLEGEYMRQNDFKRSSWGSIFLDIIAQETQRELTLNSLSSEGMDLRINPYTSECPSQHCHVCRTSIPRISPPIKKHYHCPGMKAEDMLVDYKCKGADYYWVRNNTGKDGRLRCYEGVVPVSCCMLVALYPPGTCDGNLVCSSYGYVEPKCQQCRRNIFNEPLCQTISDEMAICRCFNKKFRLCGEESLPECLDTSRSADLSVCHMGSHLQGQNCVCEFATPQDDIAALRDLDFCFE